MYASILPRANTFHLNKPFYTENVRGASTCGVLNTYNALPETGDQSKGVGESHGQRVDNSMLVGLASTNQSTKCCSMHFQTSRSRSWFGMACWQVLEWRVQLLALQPNVLPPSGAAEWHPCKFYVHGPCFWSLLPASVCACLFCPLRRHTCNRPCDHSLPLSLHLTPALLQSSAWVSFPTS